MFKFEDKIKVIDAELARRKAKWRLKAIPSIDYDDVSQIIRLHIYKKWSMWDQSRPLEPWLNIIIGHQIINLLKSLYGNLSRPCLGCAANQGADLCGIYSKQCGDCPLFSHWENGKKYAHDTKLPLPLEMHEQKVFDIPEHSSGLEGLIEDLTIKMKEISSPPYFLVYKLSYIDGLEDHEIQAILNKEFKTKYFVQSIKKHLILKIKNAIKEVSS
jgi:hypothetical protein